MTITLIGQPNDDGVLGQRSTVNQLLGFVEDAEPPPTGGTMQYKVVVTVRKRPQPSFYSDSTKDALAGFEFVSEAVQATKETINGISCTVTWVQLPDGYWAPLNHFSNGTVYVEEVQVTPPPVEVKPIKTRIEMDDGSIWEADNFTRVE